MRTRSNEEWRQALRAGGADREAALKDLREATLRVILGYLSRHRVGGARLSPEDAAQLAEDCTQETLLAILSGLETFRGESRFTTWAYQVALRAVLGELRRRRWREISLDPSRIGADLPEWPIEDRSAPDPERAFHREQIWGILHETVERDLTSRQRAVLVAAVFQGMPLDQVAEWLGTNRDNVYKILHDARRKLKKCLVERGLSRAEILAAFEGEG